MCEGLLTRRAPRGPGKFGKAGHHAKPTPGAGIDCQILSHDRHATLRTHVTAAHHRCAADRSLARRTSQRRICVVRHRGAGSGKVAAVARQRSRGSPLSERVPASDLFYDPGTGQLITGSLMDCIATRRRSLVIRSRPQRHAVHHQPARRQRLRRSRCRRRLPGRHERRPRRAGLAWYYRSRRPGDPGADLADDHRTPCVTWLGGFC